MLRIHGREVEQRVRVIVAAELGVGRASTGFNVTTTGERNGSGCNWLSR